MRYIMRVHPDQDRYPIRRTCIATAQALIPHLETVSVEGPIESFLAVMDRAGPDPFVHLEDDIDFCDHFTAHIEAEIDRRPHHPLSFFSRWQQDIEIGSRWLTGAQKPYHMAAYFPGGMAASMLRWYDPASPRASQWRKDGWRSDGLYHNWLKDHGVSAWVVCPNLIDHLDGPSTLGVRQHSRRSRTFVKRRPPPR